MEMTSNEVLNSRHMDKRQVHNQNRNQIMQEKVIDQTVYADDEKKQPSREQLVEASA